MAGIQQDGQNSRSRQDPDGAGPQGCGKHLDILLSGEKLLKVQAGE